MHQEITNKIISQLKAGTRPWERPFNGGVAGIPRRDNGEYFSGMNIIVLWLEGRANPYWMTYAQAQKLGGQVRKGEKSTKALKPFIRKDEDTGKTWASGFGWYSIFNAEQIDNLPAKYYISEQEFQNPDKPMAWVDAIITETGADIRVEGNQPCYRPATDSIHMPEWGAFKTGADYYCTILHELTHWTGHKSRENRLDIKNKKGYAFEELVAELGAAFMMVDLGITPTIREDHSQYIAGWITALESDPKYIFEAAKLASKAVGYIVKQSDVSSHNETKVA